MANNKLETENVSFNRHFDGTVSVKFDEKQYLRRMTPRSDFDLSEEPYHWGSYVEAVKQFSDYLTKNDMF